jgi:CHAT domain-containing protein/uncharacterized protein HemY
MKLLHTLCLWLACIATLAVAGNDPPPTPEQRLKLGQAAYERGATDEALTHWRQAQGSFARQRNIRGQITALVNLGMAYQALGQQRLALQALEEASRLADSEPNQPALLVARNGLGVVCGCLNQFQRATQVLRDAIVTARAANDTGMVIVLNNNLGNLLAAQHQTDDALASFLEAARLAHQQTNSLLAAKAYANAAACARPADSAQYNQAALDEIGRLPATHDQALLYLRCGQTDWRRQQPDRAAESYERARAIAEQLNDQRALTYALGYLGELRAAANQLPAAMDLTRRAAFVAQEIQLPDALYRWEWQTGRLHRAQGNRAAAIAAYRRAVETLQPIRHDLLFSPDVAGASFRETVVPVYYELTDLLLQQADTPAVLREACDTLEQLKSLELEDYLQDECLNLAHAARLENIGEKTAVIYIIPLPDRTELLVGIGRKLQRVTCPVGTERLTAEVRNFRSGLQKRTTNEYRSPARQLDQWLIAPLRPHLDAAGIQTLVFVPDGALRTIPMAALLDGERFLIEEYAVAVSPGLTLLAPRPMPRTRVKAMVAGMAKAVQNHAPLPNVAGELQSVQRAFGGTLRLDGQFTWTALKRDFADNQYQLVHFATHGRITTDASESYLLTHDGKLSLDQLEQLIRPSQFRGRPVELLTLSACDTAAGDDRAALGLAGVALKAGARSTLATLWAVHDESTALLLGEFYGQLAGPGKVTKAGAIQRAQVKVLKDARFEHPGYWAPFLLIGNWL